jgi:cytochrome c
MTSSIFLRLSSRAAVILPALCLFIGGCKPAASNTRGVDGDAARGKLLAVEYGCPACHAIPGMPVQGLVGPPLTGIGERSYLAGRLANTPENLVRWVRFPREVDPNTLMPNMGVSESDGRDLAAFVYTLR